MPMKSVPSTVLPGSYRPVQSDQGVGRWFRACAGVKEDVMDWSPAERAKYTGLGIIVLNTGCLAAFAMFTALGKIVAAPAFALVPLALIWGWIIFSVDRWLITSTHGIREAGTAHLSPAPGARGPARVHHRRAADPAHLPEHAGQHGADYPDRETRPVPERAAGLQPGVRAMGRLGCLRRQLPDRAQPAVRHPAEARHRQAAADTQLESVVGTEETQEQKLTSVAQGECAGTAGANMTGTAGDGPRCKADWAAASAYAAQCGLVNKQAQLAKLQTSIDSMIQRA